jgi:hypothetical protein
MRKKRLNKTKIFLGLGLLFTGFLFLPNHTASASSLVEPVTIDAVDYEEEEIVIKNNNNTTICFATEVDAAKGIWEEMPADSGNTTRLDFSWVSPNAVNILKIKGGDDLTATQSRIVLPGKTTKLDITINYSNINALPKSNTIAPLLNIMSSAGTGAKPINFDDLEWRKGESGKWKDINLLTVAQLEKYQIKGTDLYFRIKAVNDVTRTDVNGDPIYPDGSRGRRASAEVKVKIAKKAAAMVVGVNGEDFTADIRYGKEYRVTIGNSSTNWIQVVDREIKSLDLKNIAMKLGDTSNGITDPFPAMTLEIRDYATNKAAASKITTKPLKEQRVISSLKLVEDKAPEDATTSDSNIYISYNGNRYLIITIPSASASNPYEYCLVKPSDFDETDDTDDIFENVKVTWTSITKGTDIKILSSKALDGGRLFVRQKEIKAKEKTKTTNAIEFELASTVVVQDIKYPSNPVVEQKNFTYLKTIHYVSEDLNFDIKLNDIGREAFETEIKYIKLGTKTLDFTQDVTPVIDEDHPFDKTKQYTLSVHLNTYLWDEMPTCINKPLTIAFVNGTTDKTSVKITIKIPTKALTLTATPKKGSALGTTAIDITGSLGAGNAYIYYTSDKSMENMIYTEDSINYHTGGTPYTAGGDILITPNYYVTVIEYEVATGRFVKYKSIQITDGMITTAVTAG